MPYTNIARLFTMLYSVPFPTLMLWLKTKVWKLDRSIVNPQEIMRCQMCILKVAGTTRATIVRKNKPSLTKNIFKNVELQWMLGLSSSWLDKVSAPWQRVVIMSPSEANRCYLSNPRNWLRRSQPEHKQQQVSLSLSAFYYELYWRQRELDSAWKKISQWLSNIWGLFRYIKYRSPYSDNCSFVPQFPHR